MQLELRVKVDFFEKRNKTAKALVVLPCSDCGLQNFVEAGGSVSATSKTGIEQSDQGRDGGYGGGQVPKLFSHLSCGRVGLWSH